MPSSGGESILWKCVIRNEIKMLMKDERSYCFIFARRRSAVLGIHLIYFYFDLEKTNSHGATESE